MQSEAQEFHKWAKDAGNKLRAYVLSYASGATAVFFLALTGKDMETFTAAEQTLLIAALLLFVSTAVLCLCELNVDARRCFYIARQLERPYTDQSWAENDAFKKLRLRLIYGSYATAILATGAVVGFLILRIT
jgi:hypothetical protein